MTPRQKQHEETDTAIGAAASATAAPRPRAGRRGNHEGSITQRPDGRWHARMTADGAKRKHFYGKTRQGVAAQLTAALRDRDQGLSPVLDERQTLAHYLDSWLATMRAMVRPSTWQRYEQYIRLHTTPLLGKVALTKLTAQQVQSLYASRLEAGCSPTSVKHLHTVLHKALGDALRLGLLQRNVVDLVRAPRMRRVDMRVLSLEQVKTLLTVAQGDRFEALYTLAVTTGMRRGELLALKWRDVDLSGAAGGSANGQAALQVRATLQKMKGGFDYAEPKSARSRRRIALTAAATEALRIHRARQAEERLLVGPEWQDNDLVFCTHEGKPLIGSNVLNQNFHPLLKRAGLPRIRFHDLR
ncbi:MAG: tyrosine-type recombinase/integrase, partial [Ktedonobacterales bacterium]